MYEKLNIHLMDVVIIHLYESIINSILEGLKVRKSYDSTIREL